LLQLPGRLIKQQIESVEEVHSWEIDNYSADQEILLICRIWRSVTVLKLSAFGP
jgi:hypothetical protein